MKIILFFDRCVLFISDSIIMFSEEHLHSNSDVFYLLPYVRELLPPHYDDPESIVWLDMLSTDFEHMNNDMDLSANLLIDDLLEAMYSDMEFQDFFHNWYHQEN